MTSCTPPAGTKNGISTALLCARLERQALEIFPERRPKIFTL